MKVWLIGLRIFAALSVLTGVIYPLIVTGIGEIFMAEKANGSLVKVGNIVIGSELIAQKFEKDVYFWPRPSATDYNGVSSGGSNQSVTNPALEKFVINRKAQGFSGEMLYSSGSGLDPEISPSAAEAQVDRIISARALSAEQRALVLSLIQYYTQGRQWGFLGEPRVNVLKLNRALDKNL
ncbi:MAG: potassium-transporting ATPase subunit KdpC [Bacillota bacterium]